MENFSEISRTKLFGEIDEFDMQAMAYCFKIKFRNYNKNDYIISQGQPSEDVVMILKGGAYVENIDILGDINIITKLRSGEIYGIDNNQSENGTYNDNLIATEKTLVMTMNRHRLFTPCQNKCKRHDKIVKNLINMIIERNQDLNEKLQLLSKKSIREKVLSYLYSQSKKAGSQYFDLPFNKTELASYLAVDRSALSMVLSKLRNEGIIDFDKKHYYIKYKDIE